MDQLLHRLQRLDESYSPLDIRAHPLLPPSARSRRGHRDAATARSSRHAPIVASRRKLDSSVLYGSPRMSTGRGTMSVPSVSALMLAPASDIAASTAAAPGNKRVRDAHYFPRSATNCKTWRTRTEHERR